jgi:hypothetical protein
MALSVTQSGLNESIGPLLNLALEAEASCRRLMGPDELPSVTRGLVEIASAHGSVRLWGCSDAGQQLVGAMLLQAGSCFAPWTPGDVGGVLLVDGYIAGIAGLEGMAAHIRRLGAERVDALIVGALGVLVEPIQVSTITVLYDAQRSPCGSTARSKSTDWVIRTAI